MNWYLTIRALCVAAFGSIIAALCEADGGSRRAARRWAAYAFAFAVGGSILVSFGWTPEHP